MWSLSADVDSLRSSSQSSSQAFIKVENTNIFVYVYIQLYIYICLSLYRKADVSMFGRADMRGLRMNTLKFCATTVLQDDRKAWRRLT